MVPTLVLLAMLIVGAVLCGGMGMSQLGYPLDNNLKQWIIDQGGGVPGAGATVWERPVRLYDCVNIPAGTPLAPTVQQFSFFTQRRQLGVTNLDNPNQLPANYVLSIKAIRFRIIPAFDNQGRRLGQASSVITTLIKQQSSLSLQTFLAVPTMTLGAANFPGMAPAWLETLNDFYTNGVVLFSVAEKPVFEMRCMSTFPDGRGMQSNASSAMGTNSATTGMIQTVVAAPSNGVPVYANMFEFKSPYPLMASQNFALSYSTLQPISFIDAGTGPLVGVTEPAGSPIIAGCILAELEGMWATPASA